MSLISPLPLPQELNLEIFLMFDSSREILEAGLVCKSFHKLATEPIVWKRLVEKYWKIKEESFPRGIEDIDWIKYYRERVAFKTPVAWDAVAGITEQPIPRQSHAATSVGDNLFIFGGHQTVGETFHRRDDAWLFNPVLNKFVQLSLNGPMKPISRHKCVSFGNQVYSFGGILQDKTKINSIFRFDLTKKEFEELQVKGTPPEPRCDPVVVTYKNNIVVFGGSVGDFIFPSDIHFFDTDTQTWSQPVINGNAPSPRIGCTAVVIRDKLYLYGGGNWCRITRKYLQLFSQVWSLDLKSFEWKQEPSYGENPPMSDFLNSFVIGNHFVIEGGWYSYPWAYDTISHQWTKLSTSSLLNNNDSSCTRIGNAVYYYGGYHNMYQHHFVKMDLTHLSFLLA